MTPLTVFVRTLMKSIAICLGIAIAVVQPSLESERPRQAAAQQSPTEAAIDGLMSALSDSDPGVRRYAAVALGELHSTRAVPALIRAIRDRENEVALCAVAALGRIGDPRAQAAVARAIGDGIGLRPFDTGICRAAVHALATARSR